MCICVHVFHVFYMYLRNINFTRTILLQVSLIMPSTKGQVISFINKSNYLLFQQLTDYMKPLGVRLPPQLITSGPRQHHANKTHGSSSHPSNRKRKKCSIDLTKQFVKTLYASYALLYCMQG